MAKNNTTEASENNQPQETTAETAPPAPALNLASLDNDKVAEPTVREVNVPEEVKAFVERAYKHWQAFPKSWRDVELGSEAAVKEAVKLASEFARSTGRVFRTRKTGSATLLTYKVHDKHAADAETPESGE